MLSREVVAKLSFELSQQREVLGYVGIQDNVNNNPACFLLLVVGHVFHDVALRRKVQKLESSSQVVILQD